MPISGFWLDLLRERPYTVHELVDFIGASQPRISKHLRILRQAGLVTAQVAGRRRLYALRPEPLSELAAWLEPYRRLWFGRLDALERHLSEEEEG